MIDLHIWNNSQWKGVENVYIYIYIYIYIYNQRVIKYSIQLVEIILQCVC
jgi:hypothetical protein